MVDVILSRREDFGVFDTYISEYDRSMSLLEESCRNNQAFSSIVKKFEVKHRTGRREPESHRKSHIQISGSVSVFVEGKLGLVCVSREQILNPVFPPAPTRPLST